MKHRKRHSMTKEMCVGLFLLGVLISIAVLGFFFDKEVRAQAVDHPMVDPYVVSFGEVDNLPQLKSTEEDAIQLAFGDLGTRVVEEAKKVARCESGMRANASNTNKNGTKDTGTFQVNTIHGISERMLKDPKINAMVARKLYNEQGWNPWYSSRKCSGL